ncbi:hypothetical protein B0T10DRAFT_536696 [Thelonectria olida]|uniref:Nephrocystin 3-like N-terminal domain-containing protein n=1 Tax=Thelonectria olida TaxID=1576542 RepID=A0A9P8WED5_9HYPO|nr:hypothetical protein B0T10DRAFT_536696 [Thelonectria olida]
MLDEELEGPETVAVNDNNTYAFGRIRAHNVVIGSLPGGQYGNNSAAVVARDMVRSFPNLRFALMVGIGGAAPTKERGIRLGDVVVSEPRGALGGVVQYDLGKRLSDGQQKLRFQRTGQLNAPPAVLLGALPEMRRRQNDLRKPDSISEHLKFMDDMPEYSRPTEDRLYRADSPHAGEQDCSKCVNGLESRSPRPTSREVTVHYGIIASGNSIMKDANQRDQYSHDRELNVLCFEMEAAGLMNNFPCLVIRGMCDYSDSHKNDEWHKYAALTAAAYARELLHVVKQNKVTDYITTMGKMSEVRCLEGIQERANSIICHQRSQEEKKILEWLTPVDYGLQQSDYLKRRQPGTGQWLLNSAEYQAWLKSERQTLKTVLTSIVVEDLTTYSAKNEDTGVAYVYCSFQRQGEQTAEDLLTNLLKQLAQGRLSLPDNVKSLHEDRKKNQTRPSLDDISAALKSVVKMYLRVFIVADALDECQRGCRSTFLSQIFNLKVGTTVNFFTTSRDRRRIPRKKHEDVERYPDGQMSELPLLDEKNRDLPKDTKEQFKAQVKTSVIEAVLLSRLHLESLVDKTTTRDLTIALKALPKGKPALNQAYGMTIGRIKSQNDGFRFLAEKVLTLLTCAERLLTTLELRDALAVTSNTPKLDENKRESTSIIVSVCAGSIAVVCRTYLLYAVFETGICQTDDEFREQMQSNHLYGYAACNWGHHARKASTLSPDVIGFLERKLNVDAVIQTFMVKLLLKMEADSNAKDKYGWTPLSHAAQNGHVAIVKLLLKEGADQDIRYRESRYFSISRAAKKGHKAIVKLLVEKEANLYTKDDPGQTILSYAVSLGERAIVKLLLKKQADINTKDASGWAPLSRAITSGRKEIAKLLLKKGADLNAKDEHGWTPLFWAIETRNVSTLKLLLEKGADPNGMTLAGRHCHMP